ncbi:MAG: polyphosphate:AMP phosphotransferase [Methanomicrobiales archaeon]
MMFERYNLDLNVDEKTIDKTLPGIKVQLGALQRACRDSGIPVVILIEGWNASGITSVSGEIVQAIDPRGYNLYSIGAPTDEESAHHLVWRFFIKTPAKGRFAIFARSWYSRTLAEQLSGLNWKERLKESTSAIRNFERQLVDDGTLVLKFFLHISKEEQRSRMIERERDTLTGWMITKGDWDFHHQYDLYLPVIEQIIEETDTPFAPWTIVEATNPLYAGFKVISRITKALDKIVSGKESPTKNYRNISPKYKKRFDLDNVDLTKTVAKQDYSGQLREYQDRVREAQYLLYKRKVPLIIVYEGWDAAGKGGNILRLTASMNPRGYEVVPVSRPNDYELSHHYLWRFYTHFPKAGHITLFDRSWYGRVLVERVEGFCSEDEWKRAYNEINEMEQNFVSEGGGIVKFWLEIDQDEQLARFQQRETDSKKQWKITDEDWRNREKWNEYRGAVNEMLAKTGTLHSPWTLVESNDKFYARLKTLQTTIDYVGTLL